MNRTARSQSSLFLIELILAILFFSLGSSICIRVFAQASLMSRSAADLSFASSQVSGAADFVRHSDDPAGEAASFFPVARTDGEGFCAFYDEDRSLCGEDRAAYTMTAVLSEDDGMSLAHISMAGADGEILYELDLRFPASAGEEDDL